MTEEGGKKKDADGLTLTRNFTEAFPCSPVLGELLRLRGKNIANLIALPSDWGGK